MIIYPAIDLKDGQCVRLVRGEMDKATIFSHHPEMQAVRFEQSGFTWLHVVDLNGAFEGHVVNESAVKAILSHASIPVQLGGGIRNINDISRWLKAGVARVVLGTAALHQPEIVKQACKQFPGKIAVGIDVKDGKVAVQGWAEVSDMAPLDLALKFEDAGAAAIIYTDVSRDGVKSGPNIEEAARFAEKLSTPLILSGGVGSLKDLQNIKAKASIGIEGVIVGRALYDGSINPVDALALAHGE